MSTYWKDYKGDDEDFWEHEWNKHGTCISTLEPNCYTNYAPQQDVVDYFQKTVDLFKELNSYQVRLGLSYTIRIPSLTRF
jgi:ribonuclease T2